MVSLWCTLLAVALTFNHSTISALAQSSIPAFTTTDNSTPVITRQSAATSSKTWTIKVGASGFNFSPASISNVAVGDIVSWEFFPKEHSVARADFASACVPYETTGRDRVGFWSDTKRVDSASEPKYFSVKINSTEPIFFYCAAPNSCTKELMVGVINPNSTQTLAMQIASAKSATSQAAPGQAMPREGDASSRSPSTPDQGAGKDISTGLMIGIAVGIAVFLAMCAALCFFIGRSRALKESVKRHDERSIAKPTGVSGGGYHEFSMQHQNSFPQSQVTGGPPSPSPSQASIGTLLPAYSQVHNVHSHPTDHENAHQAGNNGHGQQVYNDRKSAQPVIAELHSPLPRQQFVAELEAPHMPVQAAKR